MAIINYDDVYEHFLDAVEAYDLISEVEADARDRLGRYLRRVKSNPTVRNLFTYLVMDDETGEISFELIRPIDDDFDSEFVMNVFAYGLCFHWVTPKYFSVLNTNQLVTGSEQKFYSQKNHMDALKVMRDKAEKDLDDVIKSYFTYNNNYIRRDDE